MRTSARRCKAAVKISGNILFSDQEKNATVVEKRGVVEVILKVMGGLLKMSFRIFFANISSYDLSWLALKIRPYFRVLTSNSYQQKTLGEPCVFWFKVKPQKNIEEKPPIPGKPEKIPF